MGKIIIIGLGPGDVGMLTLQAVEKLKSGHMVFLRTEKHPTIDYFKKENIKYHSYDFAYEREEDFDKVYEYIANDLIKKTEEFGTVIYCVPGNPLVAEKTVALLIDYGSRKEVELEIVSGMSFIDPVISSLGFDPINGLKILDGLSLGEQTVDINTDNLITQVYNKVIASDVKLKLTEIYGDDYSVYLIRAAGVKGQEKIKKVPLYGIDRVDWIDYLTSIYIPKMDKINKEVYDMNNLINIMEKLRSKEGCPWDIKQTHKSLRQYILEEAYEVVDAIESGDTDYLVEELGDLLLQIVFHSQIGREEGYFTIWDIITGICRKLIYRHPHVFGENRVNDDTEAISNWNQMKDREKNITSHYERLVDIPKGLSSLMKSYKIQEKAADVGFDWEDIKGPIEKVKEEFKEVLEEYKKGRGDYLEEELGDLLFAIVNLSRFLKINPEVALNKTINKFIERFRFMEQEAIEAGKDLNKLNLEEMEQLWNRSKVHKIKKNDKK